MTISTINKCIGTLEKLSLVTCSSGVLKLLEGTLKNVGPIVSVNTEGIKPMLWQHELSLDRLHPDKREPKLSKSDLKLNTTSFFEDYVAIGPKPR